jgi:hypothetical protein
LLQSSLQDRLVFGVLLANRKKRVMRCTVGQFARVMPFLPAA